MSKNSELKEALYEKVDKELTDYTDWLKQQSVEDILEHAYAYTTRQDIFLAIDNNDFSDEEIEKLLSFDNTLDAIMWCWQDMETDYMETLCDAVRDVAKQ